MAGARFELLVESGLLREVEQIVVDAYLDRHPSASRPAAYRWLHFEDPEPVSRLADGVGRLRRSGARFDAEAVDKACAKAAQMGLLN